MRNNIFEQISRQWDALFLKTRALKVFYWKTEKEKQIGFSVTKEYGRRDLGSIYVFYLRIYVLFLHVLLLSSKLFSYFSLCENVDTVKPRNSDIPNSGHAMNSEQND